MEKKPATKSTRMQVRDYKYLMNNRGVGQLPEKIHELVELDKNLGDFLEELFKQVVMWELTLTSVHGRIRSAELMFDEFIKKATVEDLTHWKTELGGMELDKGMRELVLKYFKNKGSD